MATGRKGRIRKTRVQRRGKSKVIDIDRGFDDVMDMVGDLEKGYSIFVGLPKERGIPEDIIAYGFFNEFGFYNIWAGRDIEERSFMRSTVDENTARYLEMLRQATIGAINQVVMFKKDGTRAMRKNYSNIGKKAVSDVKQKIADISLPPNTQWTVDKKGFQDPLRDSGDLKRFINYILVEPGHRVILPFGGDT